MDFAIGSQAKIFLFILVCMDTMLFSMSFSSFQENEPISAVHYWPDWDYNKENNLIWIDYKKKTLFLHEHVCEIYCIATDEKFEIIASIPPLIMASDPNLYNQSVMGLKKASPRFYTVMQAQDILMKFLERFTYKNTNIVCSSCPKRVHQFLARYMPDITPPISSFQGVDALKADLQKNNSSSFVKAKHATILGNIKEAIKECKYYNSLLPTVSH